MRGRKRERTEEFDEGYSRNKRILQEGIRSLSLGDVSQISSKKTEPTYNVFKVHACPGHDVFRMMMEERNDYCNCSSQSMEAQDAIQQGSEAMSVDIPTASSQLYRTQSTDDGNGMETDDLSDYDSIEEEPHNHEQSELFSSMINSGKRKYVRKVDYLVDELIRKTRKTRELPQYMQEMDAGIPPYVGPSPKTDNALSIMVPFSTEFCSLSREQIADSKIVASLPIIPDIMRSSSPPPILLSGEITHSEWCIEENADYHSSGGDEMDDMFGPSQYSVGIGYEKQSSRYTDISDGYESDMACCDESSKQYSSNGSLNSGDSGMMVDDSDDEDPFSKLDISRQSPWSSNLSTGTSWMMKPPGIGGGRGSGSVLTDPDHHNHYQDDENSEDVVNVGTF